jgi:hypothetical protein
MSFLPRRSLVRLDGSGMSKFTIEPNVSRSTRAQQIRSQGMAGR